MAQADWEGLEGVEAAERIIRAAIGCGTTEIHLSSDSDGATIFFTSADRIEFYTHIPCACRDRLRAYLRDLAGIDSWVAAPVEGFGIFVFGEATYNLEVRILKGALEDDVLIKITRD